ncbi:MAG TPA: hypothetical protein VGN75_06105, partial [Kaistia sp.]|nr:hypothetical protein [Kaistia sp.]
AVVAFVGFNFWREASAAYERHQAQQSEARYQQAEACKEAQFRLDKIERGLIVLADKASAKADVERLCG